MTDRVAGAMTEYSNVTGADLKNKDCNQVVLGSYMIAVSNALLFLLLHPWRDSGVVVEARWLPILHRYAI